MICYLLQALVNMLKFILWPSGIGQLEAGASVATWGEDCDICAAAEAMNDISATAIKHVRIRIIRRAVWLGVGKSGLQLNVRVYQGPQRKLTCSGAALLRWCDVKGRGL